MARTCTFVKADGSLCKAVPLTNHSHCHFHHRTAIRQRQIVKGRRLPILTTLEDQASIQTALMEVVARVSMGTIDPQSARIIVHALRTASMNLRTGRFSKHGWQDLRPAAMERDKMDTEANQPKKYQNAGQMFLDMLLMKKKQSEDYLAKVERGEIIPGQINHQHKEEKSQDGACKPAAGLREDVDRKDLPREEVSPLSALAAMIPDIKACAESLPRSATRHLRVTTQRPHPDRGEEPLSSLGRSTVAPASRRQCCVHTKLGRPRFAPLLRQPGVALYCTVNAVVELKFPAASHALTVIVCGPAASGVDQSMDFTEVVSMATPST
jgi:hypothetical protein